MCDGVTLPVCGVVELVFDGLLTFEGVMLVDNSGNLVVLLCEWNRMLREVEGVHPSFSQGRNSAIEYFLWLPN